MFVPPNLGRAPTMETIDAHTAELIPHPSSSQPQPPTGGVSIELDLRLAARVEQSFHRPHRVRVLVGVESDTRD